MIKGPYEYIHFYLALSTDVKPEAKLGDELYETDTRLWYIYDGSDWSQKVESGGSSTLSMAASTDPASSVAVTTAIVDAYSGVVITLTGAGNAHTIASPTILTAGKVFTVVNNDTSGANTIVVNGITITAGETQSFIWDGSAWGPTDLGITAIPVTIAQGGTGANTAALARTALGVASLTDPNTFTAAQNTAYATVASHATTSAIWAAAGNIINFTGVEVITDFPVAPQAGVQRILICASTPTFTHAGNITVTGAKTFVAEAGDVVTVTALSTTTFKINVLKWSGLAIGVLYNQTIASSATISVPQCYGGTLDNYGQAADTILTMRAAAKGMNGAICLATTVNKYFQIEPATGEIFTLDGVALTANQHIGVTAAATNQEIQWKAVQTGAATYALDFKTVLGPWVAI